MTSNRYYDYIYIIYDSLRTYILYYTFTYLAIIKYYIYIYAKYINIYM